MKLFDFFIQSNFIKDAARSPNKQTVNSFSRRIKRNLQTESNYTSQVLLEKRNICFEDIFRKKSNQIFFIHVLVPGWFNDWAGPFGFKANNARLHQRRVDGNLR